jgi:putative long chain acyl-CoA synthase
MTFGGAVAGGTRLAITHGFDPATFWDDVRRYGATIVSYTWTMLRDLVEAPRHPAERHHPVRLFIGSGMPPGIWRRVTDRFRPAGVLEFYAPSEGDVVLVNVSGAKPGSLGRPLPSSAPVAIAGYDPETDRLLTRPDGFARVCARGETGMLLAEVRADAITTAGSPLRSVFERDDAWLATGDLFMCDDDGDHWLVDHVQNLIRTAGGSVPGLPIAVALGELEAVDLAVAYGVPAAQDGPELAIAAITLRSGRRVDAADLAEALAGLAPAHRPRLVHVVEEIPRTTWYRPRSQTLRLAGIPEPGPLAWYLDASGRTYRKLTAAARRRLV